MKVHTTGEARMRLTHRLIGFMTLALLACPELSALPQIEGQVRGAGNNPSSAARLPHYILGPNDAIIILSVGAEEIANKPIRITTSGDINLPMIGRIHAAGMTLEQLEQEVTERLMKYLRQPDI